MLKAALLLSLASFKIRPNSFLGFIKNQLTAFLKLGIIVFVRLRPVKHA